ncbi:MAG: putative molybdenum carrier protein [Verrucomicrobiota bacterium]
MLRKLVSGGQTGVDRIALQWALENDWETGGWCPAGRLAEDGVIDPRFPLKETPSAEYSQRTEWNVRDSDGTVLMTKWPKLTGGTKLTKKFASKWSRPCLVVSQETTADAGKALEAFVERHWIETLNVAGPRESTEPGLETYVRGVLQEAFGSNQQTDYGNANE